MKIFYLPDLGEGLAEAEIREWYVREGDEVHVDQPLVSMETAKAVVDVPSPYAGKIVKLHGKTNDIIKTGAPFVSYAVEGETATVIPHEKNAGRGSVVGALEESSKKWDEGEIIIGSKDSAQTQAQSSKIIKAMPAARVLAKELNVDLSQVTASGPNGLITSNDVKQFSQQGQHNQPKTKTVNFPGKSEALHGVLRVMANVMEQSHREIAATTIIEDVDITHLHADADLTVLIIQAMVYACKAAPALNAWFDGVALERQLFTEVNIGIATDTPEGLFVPVIKHAEEKSKDELRKIINQYKEEVKSRSLAQANLQGATISLSNFGTITGRYATPVVVPPMVAILGAGRARDIPIVREGHIMIGRQLPLSLTFDHRAATGGEATRFLAAVIKFLQSR